MAAFATSVARHTGLGEAASGIDHHRVLLLALRSCRHFLPSYTRLCVDDQSLIFHGFDADFNIQQLLQVIVCMVDDDAMALRA